MRPDIAKRAGTAHRRVVLLALMTGLAIGAPASAQIAGVLDEPATFPFMIGDLAGFEFGGAQRLSTATGQSSEPTLMLLDAGSSNPTTAVLVQPGKDTRPPEGVSEADFAKSVLSAGTGGNTQIAVTGQKTDGPWSVVSGTATGEGSPGSVNLALRFTPAGYIVVIGIFDEASKAALLPRWERIYRSTQPR